MSIILDLYMYIIQMYNNNQIHLRKEVTYMPLYYTEVKDYEDVAWDENMHAIDSVELESICVHVEPEDPDYEPDETNDPQKWWEPYGTYHVEADSIEDAARKAVETHHNWTDARVDGKPIYVDTWGFPNEEDNNFDYATLQPSTSK